MTNFPDLDAVVDIIATHGHFDVHSSDRTLSPGQTVPDTRIIAVVPGYRHASEPAEDLQYTHCIHRYPVIGGDSITWVGPDGLLGSTTRGQFGSEPADDDTIDAVWATILQQLHITDDPHARPDED